MTPAMLALALALAAIPITWLARHRGESSPRDGKGKLGGMLVLVALSALLFGVAMGVASVVRYHAEERDLAASRPVSAEVRSCTVEIHSGVGSSSRDSYSLRCRMRYAVGARALEGEVRAGYPSRRAGYDEWVRAHPPGSRIDLAYLVSDPAVLIGFDRLVPNSTSAYAAARAALSFEILACVLFAGAVVVETRRRRRQ